MNAFDVDILRFLNQFAQHSRVFDGGDRAQRDNFRLACPDVH